MKSRRRLNSTVRRLSHMTQSLDRIRAKTSEGVALLAPHLRSWVDEHLISPRQVRLAIDTNGTSFKDLWLVTNHSGANDSSYRIVYDDETDAFGLECTLDSGVEWYMGNFGSFAEAVQNM
jgi:hypothetical protein